MAGVKTSSDTRPDIGAGETGSTLTVDLAAVTANWSDLRDRAGPAECSAVLKADAYGMGLEPVAAALAGAGCATFFVAHVFEGRRLRACLPNATIYVLNGLLPGTAPFFRDARLRPVLGSLSELEEWRDATRGVEAPFALHLDSGMNRLGVGAGHLAAAARLTAQLDLALVLSHLVWSGRGAHRPRVAQQVALFEAARAVWRDVPASLANSSGIFFGREAHHALVRPGYALFGGNPLPDAPNPMHVVATLEASVIQVHDLGAGEGVGYDGRWIARSPCRVATVGAGYADGIPCGAIGTDDEIRGSAFVHGTMCPIVGRISMDLVAVDVSAAPRVARGERVELLGRNVALDDLASRAGTIGYEILTGIGPRSHRRFVTARG